MVSFYTTTNDEIEGDNKYLYKRLIYENEQDHFKKHGLIKHLVKRLKDFYSIEGRKLKDLKLSSNIIKNK